MSAGWAVSCEPSACATALGRSEPVIPRPSGGVEPSKGSGERRSPATTAASRIATAARSRATRPAASELRRDRHERERRERREQRAERRQEPGARVAPVQDRPAGGERLRRRPRARARCSRAGRTRRSARRGDPRAGLRCRARTRSPQARPASAGGRTAASSRDPAGREAREAARQEALGHELALRLRRRALRLRALLPAPLRQRAQLVREPPGRRAAVRARDQRARDRLEDVTRQVGPDATRAVARPPGCAARSRSGRRPRTDARRRAPPRAGRRPPRRRLRASPSRRAAARARCRRACRGCRRGPVSVSNSAICASPKSSRRTSTSPDSASRTFDGFTSRCTIPRPCACASASAICAATSIAPASSSAPLRIASRSVRPGMYS